MLVFGFFGFVFCFFRQLEKAVTNYKMGDFKVCSLNVRGMRNSVKRRVVFDFVGSQHISICLLQEVHLRDDSDVRVFTREWTKGQSIWSVGGVHSSGVGIFVVLRKLG